MTIVIEAIRHSAAFAPLLYPSVQELSPGGIK